MIKRFCARSVGIIVIVSGFLVSCEAPRDTGTNPPPPPPGVTACTSMVTITVSPGTTPTFSWAPDCLLGRLIVEQGIEEKWGTETVGTNTYRSPITYDTMVDGQSKYEPGAPLVPGTTYTVSVYKWISVLPESLELIGAESFTP
jgi:hypothetical protein